MRWISVITVTIGTMTISTAGDPQFTVENKCPPLFEVVNRLETLEKRVTELEKKQGKATDKVNEGPGACPCGDACGCTPAGACGATNCPGGRKPKAGAPKTVQSHERKLNTWYIQNPDGTFTEFGGQVQSASGENCANGTCSPSSPQKGVVSYPSFGGGSFGGCSNGSCGAPNSGFGIFRRR